MSLSRPLLAAFAIGVLSLAVGAPTAPAAPAATGPRAGGAGGDGPRLELVAQPAWTALGTTAPLDLDVEGDPAELELRILLHRAVSSRIGFDETVSGRRLGTVLDGTTVPLDQLPLAGDHRRLELGVGTPAPTPPPAAPSPPTPPGAPAPPAPAAVLAVRSMGVYPLEVVLRPRGSEAVLGRFVTYLIAIDGPVDGPVDGSVVGERLRVSWLWKLREGPVVRPDATPDARVVRSLSDGGRLDRLARTLAADDLPVTVVPLPATVDGWSTLAARDPAAADGLAALRGAAETHDVIAGPWVPVDVASLEQAGLGTQVSDLIARGPDTLSSVLGVRVDTRLAYRDRLDAPTLARLRESGTDRLVVAPGTLVPVGQKFTPARPFSLTSEGRTFLAVQTDPGLTSLATRDAPPALQAQRLLAGLSVVALELPGVRRGVVVAMPDQWDPDPATIQALRDGLTDHPLLHVVSADDLFDTVPIDEADSGEVVHREVRPARPSTLPVSAARYRSVQRHLDAFAGMVGDDDPRVRAGRRALWTSLSASWTGASGRATAGAYLTGVDDVIDAFLAQVHAPGDRAVTLTSRQASVPISILNESDRALRVEVSLQSDRLLFPEGPSKTVLLPPRNTTVRIPVEVRSSGTFPVTFTIRSADGRLLIQRGRITFRSTVFSGVGVVLTVGAGGFLAVWWAHHARRERRRRRAGSGHGAEPDG